MTILRRLDRNLLFATDAGGGFQGGIRWQKPGLLFEAEKNSVDWLAGGGHNWACDVDDATVSDLSAEIIRLKKLVACGIHAPTHAGLAARVRDQRDGLVAIANGKARGHLPSR